MATNPYAQFGLNQIDIPGAGGFAGAQTNTATNPYIGMQSGQINAPQGVGTQYAGSNPYLGQTTQGVNYQAAQGAGTNAYAGANPYLSQNIDATLGDMSRQFNMTAAPAFDRMQQQSGSFGNSGVQQMQGQAYADLAKQQGQVASNMRMQDYGMQQQLAENALNRTQQLNQFNAGNQLNAGLANAGFQAGDLNRNANMFGQQSMFNAGQGNQMGQFNANLGQRGAEFNATLGANDLARNSGLAQSMSQFNAGAGNQANMFNAGAGNQFLNQFRQNQFTGDQNYLNRQQNQNQFDANMWNQRDQYGQNMDFNTWQANTNNMRNGYLDQMNMLNTMMGWQNQGINAATNQQNTPMNYWQMFNNGASQLGGMGGGQTQNMQGNPYLGAIGGWQFGRSLWGG